MAINLAGLGIIYNNSSTQNQQIFQMNAVPGSLTVVYIDGVLQNPNVYTIDKSVLMLNQPLEAGRWIYILSGQGGTFIPQSYVDKSIAPKADQTTVDQQMSGKMDKTGGEFTGNIIIPEPTNPMHPTTKQMFDSLPPIASPEYIDFAVNGKADQLWVEGQLDSKINTSAIGSKGGVPGIDSDTGKMISSQLPNHVFAGDKSFSKFGPLAEGEGQGRWFPRRSGIIKGLIAHVPPTNVPTGSSIIINLLKIFNIDIGTGTNISLFPGTDRLIISDGGNIGEYEFSFPPTFERGDAIFMSIEQVGTTTTGSNLSVQLEYEYTP